MFWPFLARACRFAGCKKAAACRLGSYTQMQNELVMNSKSWTDFSCKACQYLLESHGFDADMASRHTAAATTGEDVEIEDGDVNMPDYAQNIFDGNNQNGEDQEEENSLTLEQLVMSISPHFQAGTGA